MSISSAASAWSPFDMSPPSAGVYEVEWGEYGGVGVDTFCFYNYWDGEQWFSGHTTLEKALLSAKDIESSDCVPMGECPGEWDGIRWRVPGSNA